MEQEVTEKTEMCVWYNERAAGGSRGKRAGGGLRANDGFAEVIFPRILGLEILGQLAAPRGSRVYFGQCVAIFQ